MIVTPTEMRAIEEAAFAAGATAEGLMDAVGRRTVERLDAHPGATVIIYAGRGNNAGDVLVAADWLWRAVERPGAGRKPARCRVLLRLIEDETALGELPRRKLAALPAELPRASAEDVASAVRGRRSSRPALVLDGLLGIGARGPLREPIRSAAREINALRQAGGVEVFAMDVPSGLDAETGAADADAVVADETLTVGFPKTGLLADGAANHVGRLRVIALPEFDRAVEKMRSAEGGGRNEENAGVGSGHSALRLPRSAFERGELTTAGTLAGLLPRRVFDGHKGMFGRVGILAGSVGATGAATMCSHACARAGAGLITLLAQPEVYPTLAAAASPEVMVKPLASPTDALEMDFDVLALGPGLGRQGGEAVRALVARWPKPMVVDADGLNALAEDLSPLGRAAGPRLLTPHPGEMARLLKGAGLDEKMTRAEIVREFTERFPVTLLLKGARTLIGERGRAPAYNSTGNPGMGTGGMGDVLTGICAALGGQKLGWFDAARLGAWLHGRAADLAVAERGGPSEESLLPADLFRHFGAAFRELRGGAS